MRSFSEYYGTWLEQLRRLVRQVSEAPKPPSDQLLVKMVSHYDQYYLVKSVAAERDVLSVFAAPWSSSLERSLHWIAGWRPTTLFHLLYTESSILFDSHIMDILSGHRSGDLGDLSPNQFRRVSEVQCETVKAENGITEELSEWQESASDVGVTCADFEGKIGRLVAILRRADDLRLRTFKKVVELLTSQQALEFIVAAAELQFGVTGWGQDHDRQRANYA